MSFLFYFVLYKVTVPTLFGVIIVVGLLGNLLVVGVTLSRHKMWTTVNLPHRDALGSPKTPVSVQTVTATK